MNLPWSIFRLSPLPLGEGSGVRVLPELPEIAHLKRSLEPRLLGAVVRAVSLHRPDIVRNRSRRPRRHELLGGQTIGRLERHGKELAVVAESGPVLCIHLGMSGQLWFCPGGERLGRRDHVHCVWRIASTPRPGAHAKSEGGRLVFRDPRRFGGLWIFPSIEDLRALRWSRLGPDALSLDARTLAARLGKTARPIKTALLDQRVVAGIGNIYADEILFAARIHPLRPAGRLRRPALDTLAAAIRQTLRLATRAGGSTIRDYVDGGGRRGRFTTRHRVYGRAGEPCARCHRTLRPIRLAQRATVFCPACQRPP